MVLRRVLIPVLGAAAVNAAGRGYRCDSGRCAPSADAPSSLAQCQLICDKHANLWPQPKTVSVTGTAFTKVTGAKLDGLTGLDIDTSFLPSGDFPVSVNVADKTVSGVTLGVDESYTLTVAASKATVTAATQFGARHGLETLSQLMVKGRDGGLTLPTSCTVQDAPAFTYRGVMLDTSRHWLSPAVIERVIDAMAMNKMNRLHLHLTDTSSFPVKLTGELTSNMVTGAFDDDQVYDAAGIKALVKYGRQRGVSLVPEVDAPAHARAGWKWGQDKGVGDLVMCDDDAWGSQALEPPSGQMNLYNPNSTRVLSAVWQEIAEAFSSDVLHLGGDEVIVGADPGDVVPAFKKTAWASCWNNTKKIEAAGAKLSADKSKIILPSGRELDRSDPATFYGMWRDFTVSIVNATKASIPSGGKGMLWAGVNTGGEPVIYDLVHNSFIGEPETFLSVDHVAFQVWDNNKGSTASLAKTLAQKGFSVLLSHSDEVYMDCGASGWVKPGGYWCSLNEWFAMYTYMRRALVGYSAAERRNVIGAEAPAWAETIDGQNIMQKLWPRVSALAEGLWTDPQPAGTYPSSPSRTLSDKDFWYQADNRMQYHRERMVGRGVSAEPLQAEWCYYNPGICTVAPSP